MSKREVGVAGASQYFNVFTLRRLFNSGQEGRGTAGEFTRYDLHPTITRLTHLVLTQVVPVGKGKYGSPIVELALRTIFAMVGKMPINGISEEIAVAVLDRATVIKNLRAIADYIENYVAAA